MIAFDPVFNDLSTRPLAGNIREAANRVSGFIILLLRAPAHGLGKALRIPEEFYLLELSSGHHINDWIIHRSTPREEREFILQLATKRPFLKDASVAVAEGASLCEVSFSGKISAALQAAHLLDVPLISFDHSNWSRHQLSATAYQLDDEGEISITAVTLPNIAQVGHFADHADWFEHRRQCQISDAATLWRQRDTFFPHLEFCPSVEDKLSGIPSNSDLFAHVVDRLFDLERVANAGAPFNKDAFRTKCSPSAPSTLSQFRNHYHFRCSGGNTIICGWHLYLPDGHRIYFAHDPIRYIIGHIGEHLPTSRFP